MVLTLVRVASVCEWPSPVSSRLNSVHRVMALCLECFVPVGSAELLRGVVLLWVWSTVDAPH